MTVSICGATFGLLYVISDGHTVTSMSAILPMNSPWNRLMMTDRFKVGDRVRILEGRHRGELATILRRKTLVDHVCFGKHVGMQWTYRVSIDNYGDILPESGRLISYQERYLAPIYDGWDKTEWKDCYWKPKILEKVDV